MTKNDLDQMGQVYLIFNNVPILMGHFYYVAFQIKDAYFNLINDSVSGTYKN